MVYEARSAPHMVVWSVVGGLMRYNLLWFSSIIFTIFNQKTHYFPILYPFGALQTADWMCHLLSFRNWNRIDSAQKLQRTSYFIMICSFMEIDYNQSNEKCHTWLVDGVWCSGPNFIHSRPSNYVHKQQINKSQMQIKCIEMWCKRLPTATITIFRKIDFNFLLPPGITFHFIKTRFYRIYNIKYKEH